MTKAPPPTTVPAPKLVEPVPAPEIFVDGYGSHSVVNGMVKLTFFSVQHRIAGDGGVDGYEQRVVLRLTLPIGSAVGVQRELAALLTKVEADMRDAASVAQ